MKQTVQRAHPHVHPLRHISKGHPFITEPDGSIDIDPGLGPAQPDALGPGVLQPSPGSLVPIRRTVPRRRLKSARMGEREVATSARRETASPRIPRKSMPFACGLAGPRDDSHRRAEAVLRASPSLRPGLTPTRSHAVGSRGRTRGLPRVGQHRRELVCSEGSPLQPGQQVRQVLDRVDVSERAAREHRVRNRSSFSCDVRASKQEVPAVPPLAFDAGVPRSRCRSATRRRRGTG